MSFALLKGYIEETSKDPAEIWDWQKLVKAATRTPPDPVLSRWAPLLKSDAFAIWWRWFSEAICNPQRFVDLVAPATWTDVYADVLLRVDELYATEPKDERVAVARELTDRLHAEVIRRRDIKRTHATSADKLDLVNKAGGAPRCWLCGYLFTTEAVNRLLRRSPGVTVPLPAFVDLLRPRGIHSRDVRIEIEHKVPVASGGGGADNLALACGWCNASKGARTSLYDVDGRPPRTKYVLGGHQWYELPHPFWTVRLLATRKRCEHESGCTANAETSELFIAPAYHRGSMNPGNLQVFCGAHDPYAIDRLVDRSRAKTIWDDRKRSAA